MAGDDEADSPFSFDYEEFQVWYSDLSHRRLERARDQVQLQLNELLDGQLSPYSRARIRIAAARIKGPGRLWSKLGSKYGDAVATCDGIPDLVDDLIGVRIVCNNLSDIETVQSLLSELPSVDDGDDAAPLMIEPESERKYYLLSEVKDSGYRAYHINLVTAVAGPRAVERYRVELQVRTLMQDAWGELTHEDTYKPGARLPPLAETLARRMADLLATIDELAEDIRRQLDSAVEDSVKGPSGQIEPDAETLGPTPGPGSPIPSSELIRATREIVEGLTRTTPLVAIAHQLQGAFGSDITREWGNFGSFKQLLLAAVPDVTIVEQGPGYVVPRNVDLDSIEIPGGPTGEERLPRLVRALRAEDRNVPRVCGPDMVGLVDGLMLALSPAVWAELGIDPQGRSIGLKELSALNRYVRNSSEEVTQSMNRRGLDYLLKALLFGGNLTSDLARDDVLDAVANWIQTSAVRRGLAARESDFDEIRRWLDGEVVGG